MERKAGVELLSECKTLFPIPLDVKEALKSGLYCCGTTGSGKSDIGMYAADRLMQEGVIVVVFDPTQDWMKRSTLDKVYYPNIHDWEWRGYFGKENIVFDMSQQTIEEHQKFVEWFCKTIMKVQAELPEALRKHYFLIFEEAHTYFPQGCMTAKRYQNTVKMMTQGRNFKVRFMCITQFSSMIDKKAMRYMKQRYFGATDEPNDVEYVTKFFPKKLREFMAVELQHLLAGKFIYKYGKETQIIQIEPFETEAPPTPKIPQNCPKQFPQEDEAEYKKLRLQRYSNQNNKSLIALAIALIWLVAVLYALSQIAK